MEVWIALLIPVAVALVAAASLFGGRAGQPMLIVAFVLAVFAICLTLVAHVS